MQKENRTEGGTKSLILIFSVMVVVIVFFAAGSVSAGPMMKRQILINPNFPQITNITVSPSPAIAGDTVTFTINGINGAGKCDALEYNIGFGPVTIQPVTLPYTMKLNYPKGEYGISARGINSCGGEVLTKLTVMEPTIDSQIVNGRNLIEDYDISTLRSASNKIATDIAAFITAYNSYKTQVNACLTKHYTSTDQKGANCLSVDSVAVCTEKLFLKCTEGTHNTVHQNILDIGKDLDTIGGILHIDLQKPVRLGH